MIPLLDQQFVAHLYAPADGPHAEAAYRAIRRIWTECRSMFDLNQPIPGIGLLWAPPDDLAQLPPDGEVAIAAQERPHADCQIILRRHRDVLNLSIALAPVPTTPSNEQWLWWQDLDRQWNTVVGEHIPYLLGEVRLYLARLDLDAPIVADPELFPQLDELLPEQARDQWAAQHGVTTPDGLEIWETRTEADERARRRFVLAIPRDGDRLASTWVWSRGDTAIPPLARYLLHAAKLRYELRVWQRDGQTRELLASLDALSIALRRVDAADSAAEDLQRVHRNKTLLLLADLRALRRTVEIALDNLGRAVDLSELLTARGPFTDDADLGRSFLERLDDQMAYLDIAADRTRIIIETSNEPPPQPTRSMSGDHQTPSPTPSPDDEQARKVFVVHGRDEPARRAVFDLLTALGLHPLDWEESVEEAGSPLPFLGDVVAKAIPMVQAVVVVLAPEDVVRLHPDLHEPGEQAMETNDNMQARPNVLYELGMAMALQPDRTILLVIGDQRPIADLGGRNYVRIDDGDDFRRKIASRLKLAHCPVDLNGESWRTAGNFAALTALRRRPHC